MRKTKKKRERKRSSFDPANRYGKRGQPYFCGACGGRRTGTGSHLRHQRPPGPYVERSVYDRVHTRVGAREHEQRVLHHRVDHPGRLLIRPVPADRKQTKTKKPSYGRVLKKYRFAQ